MLVVPAYAAVHAVAGEPSLAATMWLCRVIAGVLPMLLFLRLLERFLARCAPEPPAVRLVLVAYALGSMAMTYSILYISHQLAAVCVGAAWILALESCGAEATVWARWRRPASSPARASSSTTRPRSRCRRSRSTCCPRCAGGRGGSSCARWGVAAGAAAIPIAVLLAYHAACFGEPAAHRLRRVADVRRLPPARLPRDHGAAVGGVPRLADRARQRAVRARAVVAARDPRRRAAVARGAARPRDRVRLDRGDLRAVHLVDQLLARRVVASGRGTSR